MKKLLVICGSTATGKTAIALSLAKRLTSRPVGELVSADSRQVYKGLDIGTGKDIPEGFKFRNSNLVFEHTKVGYFTNGSMRLWGYDLVGPKEEFSVAHYVDIATKIIEDIWKRKKLPILVGGTGLYIKGIVDGIDTVTVPRDRILRQSLEDKKTEVLFKILVDIDSRRARMMNSSDLKNSRRLIRAIEVAAYKKRHGFSVQMSKLVNVNTLFVGLTATREYLNERIGQRVKERLDKGIEREIRDLLKAGVNFRHQSMQSLGYKQWKEYFEKFSRPGCENTNTKDTELAESTEKRNAVEEWKRAEIQYAKRQMTWFKKDKRISWFDISKKDYVKDIEKLVREWYSSK